MNHIQEGQRVPEATFRTRENSDWVDLTSSEIFSGKTVVVFSLPGAFTPTCSSSHVPRFDQLAPTFREHGVDEIAAEQGGKVCAVSQKYDGPFAGTAQLNCRINSPAHLGPGMSRYMWIRISCCTVGITGMRK